MHLKVVLFPSFSHVLYLNIFCRTSKSLILVPCIAKGRNCAACIGACVPLHRFIADIFLNVSGGFQPWIDREGSGKLSSVRFHSLKGHLSLDPSSRSSQ